MFRSLLATVGVLCLTALATAEDKKHMAAVSFGTPNPTWKAQITAVHQVGKELWVWVEVKSSGGIAPAVLGKAKAELAFTGPDLPLKYIVSGKTWGWKNEEKDIVFLHDLPKEDQEKKVKEFKDGKLVIAVKPKDDK